ncbi:MAG: magnesium transporter [Verrucomicrobiales bacterium]|nr:magnesium transporter [Verrucomicrobiales bacterium]
MKHDAPHLTEPVLRHARKDFAVLGVEMTVAGALDAIRQRGIGEKIVYFYVVDADQRLVGVVPTRRLLTASLEQRLPEIMVSRVLAIPQTATLLEACELFVLHRFLAFPVVDEQRHVVGVVNVDLFTREVFNFTEQERIDEVFEAIGFHVSQVRDASPWRAFRFRFPWLLATIASGTICAFLAGAFELTLAKSLVLAFFLTLVLGLGESVSMQSMSVTIHALRFMQPTWRWYVRAFQREVGTALLLGVTCGAAVTAIAWLWRGAALPALVIGGGIVLSLGTACVLGLSIPAILHALKLDPKIAAGPVTLALTDIFTVLFYFTLAAWLL